LAQKFRYLYFALKYETRRKRIGLMLSNFLACCVDKKTIKRRKHQLFEGKEIASNGCSGTIGLWENIYYD
tara:strand:+ start:322 stop:531 length:210 start_codon:yes stop_codon:yes gene_type:complete